MRVLIVAPWGEALGGAETMLLTILRQSRAAGCKYLVVFLEDGPFVEQARRAGAETRVIAGRRLRDPRAFTRTALDLRRLIVSERPSVALAWSAKMHLYLATALTGMRHGRRPTVVWWQHGVPQGHWLDRLATGLPTDAVGCSSRASAEAQQRLRPARRTFVVHPGIDDPQVASRPDLGLPPGALVVGIVGRLQPWKGQDRFLQAIAHLRESWPQVHGLVVGGDAYGLSPEYARSLDQLRRNLKLDGAVRMVGQVADALPYVACMDVLVNASEEEPFGIVLIEAMALAVPVVAVARGGPVEIVDAQAGRLVTSGSARDLARGIEEVLADRARYAAGSRATFVEKFRAEAMGRHLGEQLRNVARRDG